MRGAALVVLVVFAALLLAAAWWWRDDILRAGLDPKEPFQTYQPPPAPNYARVDAWALLPPHPGAPGAGDSSADVFFIHPTTYDGGREWNAPIDDAPSRKVLAEVMLPNYAGPFQRVGRVFAPRYRQSSLYSFLTVRDDARDARRFAYGDVRRAFDAYVDQYGGSRPLILVGVEQGAFLASRLAKEVAADPRFAARLVAVYLIGAPVPLADYAPRSALPACARRDMARCVVAYTQAATALDGPDHVLDRAFVWGPDGQLAKLEDRPALCVNPLTGAVDRPDAPERTNLGAAAATGLEWGERPAFLPRQTAARCVDGLLRTTRPRSASLRRSGGWTARLKAPGYNLFYADLEADAEARFAAWKMEPDRARHSAVSVR